MTNDLSADAVTRAHDPAPRAWGGLLLVVLAGAIWGTIGPGVSLVHGWSGLGPVVMSAYRAAVAVVVLVGAVLVAGRVRRRFLAARAQWRRVGVVGLLLVSVVGGGGDAGPHPGLGVLASLVSGAAYGLSAHVSGPLSRRLDALTMTSAVRVVAAVVLVPAGVLLTGLRGERVATTDAAAWLGIVYLGVVTMALAWAVFFTGLRSTASGVAMVATLVEPVTAVLIAVVLLHERLTPAGALGCVLILGAVASLGRRPTEPPPR